METRTLPAAKTVEPYFPESDGQPMGETGIHVKVILHVLAVLLAFFRKRNDILVGANQFMYWDADDPSQVAAPDVYVIFGVSPEPRRTIKTWIEGKAPDVVFEITSRKTKAEDLGTKRALYEELGVREYFLFDPENDYLRPPLQGFRLNEQGRYAPLSGQTLHSELLGVDLKIIGGTLRLFDSATDKILLGWDESAEVIEAQTDQIEQQTDQIEQQINQIAQQTDQIEQQTERIEQQAKQLGDVQRRADSAEADAARLRAELEAARRKK